MARRTANISPEVFDHLQWLGFAQPTGLVVSAPALVARGAILNRNHAEAQRKLISATVETPLGLPDEPVTYLPDIRRFAESVLGWQMAGKWYAGTEQRPIPDALKVPLPDEDDQLEPTFAVRTRSPEDTDDDPKFQLLVTTVGPQTDLDKAVPGTTRKTHGLEASPHSRMERLLRSTDVTAGLLFNGQVIRLISAPRGESSGWLDFRVADMVQTAGRPLCSALDLLLSQNRLLTGDVNSRLPALLEESRKYQNTVSEKLAEQVLHALYELVRGFHAANVQSEGELLEDVLDKDPDAIYQALVTVILRMVFVLYAEERNLLPTDEAFVNHYSVSGLYDRLRQDASQYPDTMDHRHGAWPQLLVLFRMIHDGAQCQSLDLPARQGHLFDPDRYPFLEGRTKDRVPDQRLTFPLIPDGHIHRALEKLLILDGERISYRALDVEQIGSVYETMMGFRIETAQGISLAIKAPKAHGAPTTINLEELLAVEPKKRDKWLKDNADRKLTAKQKKPVVDATTLDELQEALDKVIDKQATPDHVPKGALVLQPSDARRRSGSHYTPRSLTEPIVRKTFEPIFKRLEEEAIADGLPGVTPEQLLDLKVCDPAMGSGAFLVEACRQLADQLVAAWKRHDSMPTIPPDEDELLYARREIAQRCLYGVDKNPMAVDLGKLSIWLATLARDHAFTFLDHTFRCGDSLVGLTRKQIQEFTWETKGHAQQKLFAQKVVTRVEAALSARQEILLAGDFKSPEVKKQKLAVADERLDTVRMVGDLAVAAFFAGAKAKERKELREEYLGLLNDHFNPEDTTVQPLMKINERIAALKAGEKGVTPFHWEIEFPEVFGRENVGFDAMVGNPPFLGCQQISEITGGPKYQHWLKTSTAPCKGHIDLAVFFYRRAFDLICCGGTFGLIATSAISFGDNRIEGLGWLSKNGGTLYSANTKTPWPGQATVLISTINVAKKLENEADIQRTLDGVTCKSINSRLQPRPEYDDPKLLQCNSGLATQGTSIRGAGFVLDESEGIALRRKHPHNQEVILALTGGEEVNASPSQQNKRYVIAFKNRSLTEAGKWPEVLSIVRERVLPQRMKAKNHGPGAHGKKFWWQPAMRADHLYETISEIDRCLIISQVSTHHSIRFDSTDRLFNHKVFVFAFDQFWAFAVMQSSLHLHWSLQYSSRLGFAINYSVANTFMTFPFPEDFQNNPALEAAGQTYYDYRAALMIEHDEGLTKTYNRFHDPEEDNEKILKLRELHATMDRAVLDAYGWTDISTDCEFILDYEEEEDASRGKRKKKKPWRYRWPDAVRDEVLARLLELNAERAAEEAEAGLAAKPVKKSRGRKKKRAGRAGPSSPLYTEHGLSDPPGEAAR